MIDLKNLNIITGATGIIGIQFLEKLIWEVKYFSHWYKWRKIRKIKNKYENINTLKFDISKHNEIEICDSCNTTYQIKLMFD